MVVGDAGGGGQRRGAGRASSGSAAPPSCPQENGAGLSRRFSSAGSGVRSMVGKERKGKSLARSFAFPERIQRQGLAVASQRPPAAAAAAGEAPAGVGVRRGAAPARLSARLPSRRCTRRARKPLRRHAPRERLRDNCHALTASTVAGAGGALLLRGRREPPVPSRRSALGGRPAPPRLASPRLALPCGGRQDSGPAAAPAAGQRRNPAAPGPQENAPSVCVKQIFLQRYHGKVARTAFRAQKEYRSFFPLRTVPLFFLFFF
ncbi:uncharacterized protein LOC142057868 [Phalacrocorax aristotelis]|uniref:uncharacterized protein LOC142057868 n=1 Tax=Phalacrocorax aristotelis TaxID=126867 RepID=UPI003F4BBEE5